MEGAHVVVDGRIVSCDSGGVTYGIDDVAYGRREPGDDLVWREDGRD